MRRCGVALLGCVVVGPVGCGISLTGLGDETALGDATQDDATPDLGMQDARDDEDGAPATRNDADASPPIDAEDAVALSDATDTPIDVAPDVPPPPPSCDPTDVDLVACYRFEPGATQPHDESGYHNDGTSTGVGSLAGISGRAASFDGLTSYDHVADSPSLDLPSGQITMETWFLMRTAPRTARSGLLDEDGQYGMFLLATNQLRCAMAPGIVDTPPGTVTLGVWTHAACTYDGALIKVFLDGALAAEAAAAGTISPAGVNGLSLGMNSPSGDVLDGALDDLRIFRVARTDAQIALDAKKPIP
jgi:hypothetical protein